MLRASATSIKLTPVYNSSTNTNTDGSSADLPYSYFLEVDGIRVLLDCGWNDNFETEYLAALYPYLSQVDAVLLSSADMKACGALPFVVEHLRPGAVIAAVGSTSKLGLHSLLNCFLSHYPNTHDFGVFTGESSSLATFQLSIDKIYSAFRSVSEPYGGTVSVVKDERSMSCHATFAGRMLGGHVWELKYQIDSILYCPDFSAIPSYALKRFKVPTTPNIVLLEGYPIHIVRNKISSSKYEEQLEALFKDIQRTMRGGGDVLIPVSAAGRGLEMLIILLHLLMEKGGERYKVVFASLQSQELLDKASTMTEAFQDSIILSDRQLFANVIACKNTQEVLQIPSPKVCIADGESLDYGISADLLEHFLPHKSSDNSENMIVLPDVPKAGTTASAIAESVQHQPFSYSYLQRTLLSKEELEEYYLQQEHDAELKRTQLNDHEGFKVVDDEEEQSAADDDDDDADEVGEAADSAENRNLVESQTKTQKPNTPGLVLPAYIHFNSRHLNFPSLTNDNTLCAARSKGIDTAYGLPLSEAEYQVMHKRAPIRSDQGPDGPLIFNDAQREANTPAKVMEVTKQVMRNCRLVISDLSGSPDAHTLKSLINSKLSFAKKLVSIRSSPEDHRLLALFCRGEKHLKCSEQVHMATAKGVAVELATQVFSYVVQLNHELAHALPASLRRVRENHSKEAWEVGWTNGELRRLGGREEVKDQDDGQPDAQRLRLEEEARLALVPLADSKRQQCAEQIEESGIQRGSFFVGSMDLHRLRDTTRRDAGLYSEFHKTAPMLVYDSGACVRRGENGTVTIACVASPSMFDVRRSVYAQFAQTL